VDTAENVQISSLALLKMLKHGTWRDRATTPRATGVARGSLVDDEPQCEAANPPRRCRGERPPRSEALGRPRSVASRRKGFLNRSGASAFRRFAAFGATVTHPRFFSMCFSIIIDDRLDDVALTFPFLSLTCDFPFHDLTFSRHLARHLPAPRSLQAARASRWR
jgi:hypothetical protein